MMSLRYESSYIFLFFFAACKGSLHLIPFRQLNRIGNILQALVREYLHTPGLQNVLKALDQEKVKQ